MDNLVDSILNGDTLESWVMAKCDSWRDHYNSNYQEKHDEYYRIWRGIWSASDKTRDSERSKLISPATQQAVESSVAEIEEATFGRGRWFDIEDDDSDSEDIVKLRENLYLDSKKTKTRQAVGECLINAAVFGTGIAEIVMDEVQETKPATQPIMGGELQAVGVTVERRTVCKVRPVMPQNFLIDPAATNIEEALGVAIDEYVPKHQVEMLQESGVYNDDVIIDSDPTDLNITPDKNLTHIEDDGKVRLTKYFGLVPRRLLENPTEDDEFENIVQSEGNDSQYVEAVVIIANKQYVMKAEENPYMMQDRPVVAFPWDVVPGRFWGRGVCEKAYNSQKALDAELRGRTDALALTIHPMMAMDATRMPRGQRPEVRPGKILLTNGDPSNAIQPFNFGNVSQITFAQAAQLERMVQSSTGAVDSTGTAGAINGEATAAGISMSLGAIIKRHKRTLINFQECFLIPMVTKKAHRYMQFEPELYPTADYTFNATSTLGIIAREYEVTQLVQLLQTMDRESPAYLALVQSIIDNMNLSNREELIKIIQESAQPSEAEQQAAQQAQQAALEFQASQTNALNSQAARDQASAQKYLAEAEAVPEKVRQEMIKIITADVDEATDREFKQRVEIAKLLNAEQAVQRKGAVQ
jgi:hypothetical protein